MNTFICIKFSHYYLTLQLSHKGRKAISDTKNQQKGTESKTTKGDRRCDHTAFTTVTTVHCTNQDSFKKTPT